MSLTFININITFIVHLFKWSKVAQGSETILI